MSVKANTDSELHTDSTPLNISGNRPIWTDWIGLLGIGLLIRLVTMGTVETGGDAYHYWLDAYKILSGVQIGSYEYPINHWSTRFGIILPTLLSQYIFGTDLRVYYIVPILMFLVQVSIVFFIGTLFYDNRVGIIASVLLIFFPQMIRSGGQLLPEAISGTYIAMSLWFIYWHNIRKKIILVILSVFFFCCAYITHEINIFYLIGIVLGFYTINRRAREPLLFLMAFLFFVGCEWLYYIYQHDLIHGRVDVIKTHTSNIKLTPILFWNLFERFSLSNLGYHWLITLCLSFSAAIYQFIKGKTITRVLVGIFISFLLGITFSVKSLDPIIPATRFLSRYFTSLAPVCFLLLSVTICDIYDITMRYLSSHKYDFFVILKGHFDVHHRYLAIALSIPLMILYSIPIYSSLSFMYNFPFHNAIGAMHAYSEYFLEAYTRRIPIVCYETKTIKMWPRFVLDTKLETNNKRSYEVYSFTHPSCKRLLYFFNYEPTKSKDNDNLVSYNGPLLLLSTVRMYLHAKFINSKDICNN